MQLRSDDPDPNVREIEELEWPIPDPPTPKQERFAAKHPRRRDLPPWTWTGHWHEYGIPGGACGESCGCCRWKQGEVFGYCPYCEEADNEEDRSYFVPLTRGDPLWHTDVIPDTLPPLHAELREGYLGPQRSTNTLEALAFGDEEILCRPCVDCGLFTGCFCDYCYAKDRIENEVWAIGQHTPLCTNCDKAHDRCRYCRGISSCTPPSHRGAGCGRPLSR